MAKLLDVYTMDFYIICHQHIVSHNIDDRFYLMEYLDKWHSNVSHIGDKFAILGLSHSLADDEAPSYAGQIIKTTDTRQKIVDCVLSTVLTSFRPKISKTIKSASITQHFFPKLILSIN